MIIATTAPNLPVMAWRGRVMVQIGHLGTWLDGDIADLVVGAPIGPSAEQSAYERWPVYQDGERIATLVDGPDGHAFRLVDDEGEDIED